MSAISAASVFSDDVNVSDRIREVGRDPDKYLGVLVYPAMGHRGIRVPKVRTWAAIGEHDPNGDLGLMNLWEAGQKKLYPNSAEAPYIAVCRLTSDRWVIHANQNLAWTACVPHTSNPTGDADGAFVGATGRSRTKADKLYWELAETTYVDGKQEVERWGILVYTAPTTNTPPLVEFFGPQATRIMDSSSNKPLSEAFMSTFVEVLNTHFTSDFTNFLEAAGNKVSAIPFTDGPRFFVPCHGAEIMAGVAGVMCDAEGRSMAVKADIVANTELDRAQRADDAAQIFEAAQVRMTEFVKSMISDDRKRTVSKKAVKGELDRVSADLQMLEFYSDLLGSRWTTLQTQLSSAKMVLGAFIM